MPDQLFFCSAVARCWKIWAKQRRVFCCLLSTAHAEDPLNIGRTMRARARDILACCDASLLIPVRSARALQIVGTFSRGSCLCNVQREVSTPERGDAPSEQSNPPTGDAAAVRRLNAPRPPRDGLLRPLDGTTAGRREIVVYSGTCDATWDLSTGSEDLRASENSAHVDHFCEVHVCWRSFMRKGQQQKHVAFS